MLDEEITTWQKHVSTRWNSILNPCKKLVKNYETISKFILEEMPKLDKKVRSSAVYKNLENFFQPENKESNLSKLYYIIHLCEINERFLMRFQTDSPSIPFLLRESKELIRNVIDTVAHTKSLSDNLEVVNIEEYCTKYQRRTYTFGAQDANLEDISAETITMLRKPVLKTVTKVIYDILIFILVAALINYAH